MQDQRRASLLAHPPRFEYHLTRKGVDLQPVLIGLMQWGDRYVADPGGAPWCSSTVRAATRFDW